jgi:hypothetical protein
MVKQAVILIFFTLIVGQIAAQDTLPKFSVTTRGNNRILVNWNNNYKSVVQISIQRSIDSLRNFKTILSVPDPNVPQNGFVDTKAPAPNMFYRLFIVLDSGKYLFSAAKRPVLDTTKLVEKVTVDKNPIVTNNNKRVIIDNTLNSSDAEKIREKLENKTVDSGSIAKPVPEKFFTVKKRDTVLYQISEKKFKAFRDSLVSKTKDTLVFRSADTIVIKPFVPREVYKPSIYVFTEKDGNINISLPDVANKHYSIKFFDDKNEPLFEITKVKESPLLLDKSNFLHAGWFKFELYEEGKLKEKHKFMIPKEF